MPAVEVLTASDNSTRARVAPDRGPGACVLLVATGTSVPGQIPLSGRKTRRIVPAQSGADVVMHPRLRASDLVGAPMHLPYLLEQRLEDLVVDRQERRTLLALARRQDKPVAADAAGGRFYGRNLQRTGPPAAARALLHTRAERGHLRCAQSDEPLAHPPLVLLPDCGQRIAPAVVTEAARTRAVRGGYR